MSATVVVDLGYGDAGKGTIVDRLCSPASQGCQPTLVVRFNGGPQAAHNVVLPDGRHHTFSQFGSGTLHGVPTLLSRFVAVDPCKAAVEAEHLEHLGVDRPLRLLHIDQQCRIVTPAHQKGQRVLETTGTSCGTGFGPCVRAHNDYSLTIGDLCKPLSWIKQRLLDIYSWDANADLSEIDDLISLYKEFAHQIVVTYDLECLNNTLCRRERADVVFEGAQGVLLDMHQGFNPFTTWSTTTDANAQFLLGALGYPVSMETLGVVRTYTTRHGAGPHVSEKGGLAGLRAERHNTDNPWQGPWRTGPFDLVAHSYAAACVPKLDGLAITHLDVETNEYCRGYKEPLGKGVISELIKVVPDYTTKNLMECQPLFRAFESDGRERADEIGQLMERPVLMESWGPTWRDKIERVLA